MVSIDVIFLYNNLYNISVSFTAILIFTAMSKSQLKLADELQNTAIGVQDPRLSVYCEALYNSAQSMDNLSTELVSIN